MISSVRYVATLIGAAHGAGFSDALLSDAKQALRALGAEIVSAEILEEGTAVDLFFELGRDRAARGATEAIRALFAEEPLDVVVQPAACRRKKLLLADMDSTIIGQECIDELADVAGLRAKVSAITDRAMRGEIAFEPALRERVALLRGLDETVVARIIKERITATPGASALVQTMRANGAHATLVSGGFTVFTRPVAEAIGFDEHRANRLIVEGGRFAGCVSEPILGREAKLAALIELRERYGLRKEETLAVGDGANDLAMLGEAGLGIAYHAKPAVAATAHARIEHCDLTALLYAQGYRRADFINA